MTPQRQVELCQFWKEVAQAWGWRDVSMRGQSELRPGDRVGPWVVGDVYLLTPGPDGVLLKKWQLKDPPLRPWYCTID